MLVHTSICTMASLALYSCVNARFQAKKKAKAAAKDNGKGGQKPKTAAAQLKLNVNNLKQSEDDFLNWHFSDIPKLKREVFMLGEKTLRQHLRAGFDTLVLAGKTKVDMSWLMGLRKAFDEADIAEEPGVAAVEVATIKVDENGKLEAFSLFI